MTDQPNPVGLKKEISGHPTDHSRKAVESFTRCSHCGYIFSDGEIHVVTYRRGVITCETEKQPSLPEEGGQRLPDPKLPQKLWDKYDHAVEKAYSVGALKMLKNAEADIGRWYVENFNDKAVAIREAQGRGR